METSQKLKREQTLLNEWGQLGIRWHEVMIKDAYVSDASMNALIIVEVCVLKELLQLGYILKDFLSIFSTCGRCVAGSVWK